MQRQDLAQKGKSSENTIRQVLERLRAKYAWFDFQRLPDARSAHGHIPKQIGDFLAFSPGRHYAFDVKELKHAYRLPMKNVSQLSMMWRRRHAGGDCFLLVHHTQEKLWRLVDIDWLWDNRPETDSGSWNLSQDFPTMTLASLVQTLTNRFEGRGDAAV